LDIYAIMRFGTIIVVLFVVYKIILKGLKVTLEKRKIPIDAMNGFKFILRFFCVFIAAFSFFVMLGIDSESLISISTISGMIIGFASSEVMAQVAAGFYIIIAKPFGVRDLVKIDSTEGIVLDIGITYTRIQRFDGTLVKIPNKKIMDSKIKNYTIDTSKMNRNLVKNLKKGNKIERINLKDGIDPNEIQAVLGHLADFIAEDEVTRYLFAIELDLGLDPNNVFNEMENICEKYRPIFGFKPIFIVSNLGYRVELSFRIYSLNPRLIMNNIPQTMEDIAMVLYGTNKEETN